MPQDTDVLADAITALAPPLLTALDALAHVGRRLHPPDVPALVEEAQQWRQPLLAGREAFMAVQWPARLSRFAAHCRDASGHALLAFDALRVAVGSAQPAMGAYRALSNVVRANEALYPVSLMLPPVSRYFVHKDHRQDEALAAKLAAADATRDNVGILHFDNKAGQRGGFSLYVPEYHDGETRPLIVALHGGSGHGRSFLWSWLRDARTRGAVLASPSSQERTWNLMDPNADNAALDAMVSHIKANWPIDAGRVLLTGMSDGGTFSYLCGLRENAPFTHLAPCSASFHPLLLEAVDGNRLRNLPVYLMHGALDWMFPIEMARTARDALSAAGARVSYREIADLSHTYPVEENERIIDWMTGSS